MVQLQLWFRIMIPYRISMQFLYILALVFMLFSFPVSAQQRQLIEGDFTGSTFNQVVNSIEAQTSYKIYYDPLWTDTLKIQGAFKNALLHDVLNKLFENSDLKFVVHDNTLVFITRGRQILAHLPDNYFNETTLSNREPVAFDFSAYETREKEKKIVEAKLYSLGTRTGSLDGTATVIGKLQDGSTGEPVIGATIYIENPMIGAVSDQNGFYSLTLPKGRHELHIKSMVMKSTVRQIMLYGDSRLNIDLEEEITPLKEVVIESERDVRVTGMQMGVEKLDIRTMKQLPLALGETDIMKVMLALPGVQSVGEGSSGLNVRGGAANQNLILFNDAVVFNPSHLFGFFSTFNPDVLKSVELYKSGVTADFGGRLSSVIDVHTREGNTKKISGSGGISPITGRLTLEGPIIKDRTSFIVGARTTYSNWLLRQLKSKELKNSDASFYDITATLSHKINDDNSLYLSSYISNDQFRLNGDTTYRYSDRNASLKWKHVFNNKLFALVTGSYSKYSYSISGDQNPATAFDMDFSITQNNGKIDFNYFPNSKHVLTGGISVTQYGIFPGRTQPKGEGSIVEKKQIQRERGIESALYVGDNYEVNSRFSVYLGLRYSLYAYLGPRDVFVYQGEGGLEKQNITDTVSYASGKSIQRYHGLEPRVSLRYLLPMNASLKLSYNRMRQYVQMLSNTTAITPTDIWKLSDNYIKPQIGDQFAIGIYKNLKGNVIETSVEAYYKNIISTPDFKDAAVLVSNNHVETEILNAEGKSYGVEFMIKKSQGKTNGWISYTYSRSFLKTKGSFPGETVNGGAYYPNSFDKPHAINFISNYKFNRRINFSLNIVYSTGRPITLPIGKYTIEGSERIFYSERNQYRIPDYFRSDISINIEGNHKVRKLAHSSWTFAIYNVLGRANAYSVYFVSEEGKVKGYKLSIFARPIPTITYNFKF